MVPYIFNVGENILLVGRVEYVLFWRMVSRFFKYRYQFYVLDLGVGFMRELRENIVGLEGVRD